jgi:hypothetical protein
MHQEKMNEVTRILSAIDSDPLAAKNCSLWFIPNSACSRFRRAHEEWRKLAWGTAKDPTEPNIDLTTIEFELAV